MPYSTADYDNIAHLKKFIGKEISDNFSPTLRSTISESLGNGYFRLTNGNYARNVFYYELDMMIYGR